MKVTVYFGNVRVIVPCGNGDILVRELMELAITRYKKATRKCPSSVVTIHNLKSSRDEGILYPDDRLDDVADDREQIIAVFEENGRPPSPCGGGSTGSPDLFSVEVGSHYNPSDGEATDEQGPAMLQVRRGSEPALNCLFPPVDLNKRWSTAVVIHPAPDLNGNGPEEEDVGSTGGSFLRGSGRLSVLGSDAETCRWVEAADRQLMKDFNENFTLKVCNGNGAEESDGSEDEREKTIVLKNESGPLGIHVVPDYDGRGRDTGLVIQGIETGGRIDRDGRFRVGDRITRINGKSLQDVSFQTAQEVFKDALRASRIRLELVRETRAAAVPRKPPPPVYPPAEGRRGPEEDLVEGEERAGGTSTRVATVTPTKKVPASATRRLASANTRRIGRMINVHLTKGESGLGFSITTRDNSAGGRSPIYVKNILPKGAAVEEGSLLPGDRLLEVNGIPMTGKSQAEAVRVLRDIPPGESVRLVVSRQEAEEEHAPENNGTASEQPEEEGAGVFPWKHREILTFRIPLDEAHPGGLGVSVKGKSTSAPGGSVDLGIFIKGVIPGGAADKDGRLQTDDQLVNVNGISLLGTSNTDAMETLRGAMSRSDGPIRNAVILTVARRASRPPSETGDATASSSLWDGTWNGTRDGEERTDPAENALPPGRNPVLERLTGRDPEDARGYRLPQMIVTGADERVPETYSSVPAGADAVLIEGEYDPKLKKVPAPEGVAPASSQLSLVDDGSGEGFARDGFGRQSMSEKRHAQLDARSTDTYQRSKRAKEERQKQTDGSEGVGPSLGLRKSSSLESLQTMMRELDREDEEAERRRRRAAQSTRSRGCNESFRAAVDRSYDAPPPNAMETLDEESESGSSSGHLLTRSADLADHADVYGSSGKASKKKGLLKGLGSVFKFGKRGKDSRGRSDEDEESHRSESRESDRAPSDPVQGRRLPPVPPRGMEEAAPSNRQERMQSLREQHQRMHQRRQGQYPLDHREEYLENVLQEKEKWVPPYEVVHGRSRSLDVHEETHRIVDPGRYGHYVNYEEIRQQARRRAAPAAEGARAPVEAPHYGRAAMHGLHDNRLYTRIVPGSKV